MSSSSSVSATKLPKADGTIGPFGGESEVDGQAQGGRRRQSQISQAVPTLTGLSKPAGQFRRSTSCSSSNVNNDPRPTTARSNG
ncbi:hypothetical protein J3458_015293 [Metarhizium acridum]|uniref:uncharacterized protein n=1 Tax=Metarhizium acridum TaxID=92637 RepID=UPI001C6B961D|nr:hypothetical protein J3458_015293 [Metarhizium acridum]